MARLELIPTDEEREIRAAVRGICDSFPEDYSRRKHAEGEPPTELWWGVRLTRTAPVSREMILNYVAEHSLGLPKSY